MVRASGAREAPDAVSKFGVAIPSSAREGAACTDALWAGTFFARACVLMHGRVGASRDGELAHTEGKQQLSA